MATEKGDCGMLRTFPAPAEIVKILFVKTSSLGDLIHSMPAISDLQRSRPDIELHWLVEEGFAAIPQWHPFVKKVFTCAIRRWRHSFFTSSTQQEIRCLKQRLLSENYDAVVDAQGLVKSALMVRWLCCERHGYDRNSIREPLATLAYSQRYAIPRKQGAIERVRQLLSSSLGYSLQGLPLQFGLSVSRPESIPVDLSRPYVIFLHGTNWESKIWPVAFWQTLARTLSAQGFVVYLPWGSADEQQRAEMIAAGSGASVLPRLPLAALAYLLQNAARVVGSDTGLTHLAAALGAITVGIYGSTSTQLTGLVGDRVVNLTSAKECSPCFQRECPLEKPQGVIPCYETVPPKRVLAEMSEEKP
jgi:heptosyltransferase-1